MAPPPVVEKRLVLARELDERSSAITNRTLELTLKKQNVFIIEIEDVLFHHDSAVLLPVDPVGPSSEQGVAHSKAQEANSGLVALALVMKQFELDNTKRLLITAHSDSSETARNHFEISEKRAQNVFYLLVGNKTAWAEVCAKQHTIEDYQVILYFINFITGWNCDPAELNNTWGQGTEKATRNYLKKAFETKKIATKPDVIMSAILSDGAKKWPKEAWLPVYDFYNQALESGLCIDGKQLQERRNQIHFVDNSRPWVSCGVSYPIDQTSKPNYKSQTNRRVEFLLFDKDEISPNVLKKRCPINTKSQSPHELVRCPFYPLPVKPPIADQKDHFRQRYLAADDLKCIALHLKFEYFDQIKKKRMVVPEIKDLDLKIFENGNTEINKSNITVSYKNGVVLIKIKFDDSLLKHPKDKLHVQFSTSDLWIFTEKTQSVPVIKKIPKATVDAYPAKDRIHYYDIPKRWDSRNWVCSCKRKINVFQELIKGTTSVENPILFNLDAIILVDSAGSQKMKDTEYNSASGVATTVDCSAESRITLFYLDQNKTNQLKIYKKRADAKHYSQINFRKNFINMTPDAVCRIVYFNNAFYDITWKRTEPLPADIADANKKFVCGARAAVFEDNDNHVKKTVCVNLTTGAPPNDYSQKWCGNYELHFFDSCEILNDQPLSYLMIYWNCRLIPKAPHAAAAGAITNWVKDGMQNSMERSNRPFIIKKKDGACNSLIRPFHFYEAKSNNRNGKHKCMVGVTTVDEDWMLPEEARFCNLSYTYRAGYYGPDTIADIDGTRATPLMSAHEMGHATGCFDDYLYNLEDGGAVYSGIPSYSQPYTAPGAPYHLDTAARMETCRLPRMRDLWHFVNWLNDDAKAGKPLNKFLKGSSFKMTYTFTDPSTAAAKTIDLDLDDPKFRDTSKPSYKEDAFIGFAGRNVSLFLYKLGGGETAELLIPHHVLDAILVINIKIAIKFVGINTVLARKNWIINHLLTPLNAMNSRFFLLCATGNKFKRTLLTITPYFTLFNGAAAPAGSHYSVIVDNSTPQEIVTAGTVVKVKAAVNGMKIIRYIFGLPTNSINQLTANNFNPVATWIGTAAVANGAFTVQTF